MPRAGTAYEKAVAERYGFRVTSNSGAVHGDADLRHDGGRFIVECKDRGTEAFSIPGSDVKKMDREARLYGDGNWVRFMQNKEGRTVVAMNEELFKVLLDIADGVIKCPCGKKIQPDW